MADPKTPGRPSVGRVRNDAEHADLLTYHFTLLRQGQAAVVTAKAPLEEAKAKVSEKQEDLTKLFNAAKADLGRGYTRKYLESLLADAREKITGLVELETQRARDKLVLNQPVYGAQPELFPGAETPTAAKDEMAWEAEGVLRGMRGDLEELQPTDPPAFHQAIMKGFRDGQAVAQQRFLRAQEALKAAANPDAGAPAKDLSGGAETPEPTAAEQRRAERKSVDRAKESLGKLGSDAAANQVPA